MSARIKATFFAVMSFNALAWGADAPELIIDAARSSVVITSTPAGLVTIAYDYRDRTGSNFYITSTGNNGTLTTMPPYSLFGTGAASAGGAVYSASTDGFIPIRYHYVSPTGTITQRPTYPAIAGELYGFSIGSQSTVAFVGRHGSTTGVNLLYIDRPALDTQAQLVDTSSIRTGNQTFQNSTMVDAQGRVYVSRMDGGTGTVYRYDNGTWTNLNIYGDYLYPIKMLQNGEFVYTTELNPRVVSTSARSVDQPLHSFSTPIRSIGAAENGAIAAADNTTALYFRADGSTIDLGALAGPGNIPNGILSINSLGEVAMLTSNGGSRTLWWFDGGTLHRVMDNFPQVNSFAFDSPRFTLTDADELYYVTASGPGAFDTQIWRIQHVPEPGLASLSIAGVAILLRRRRTRRAC